MSGTKRVTQRKSAPVYGFKAVDGAPAGTFEAIVSVFSNVDYGNERVMPGFFQKSIDAWRSSGDPIPVIFSHQWENLDAHVGTASPADVKELLPGDPMLPEEIRHLGGLYVKGTMEMDEPFAARLWKKMSQRAIREFSFAYDVTSAKPGPNGALDLVEGDLIEVGPTLKGMNPATALISAKASNGPLEALDAADAVLEDLGVDAPAAPAPESAAGGDLVDVPPAVEAPAADTKAALPLDLAGSLEGEIAAVREAAEVWAGLEYGNDLYYLHLEATYPADGRAVVIAERWEDPLGGGPVWSLSYEVGEDGLAAITEATEMELEVSMRPKALEVFTRLAGKAALGKSPAGTAPAGIVTPSSEGKTEDSIVGKVDDPPAGDTTAQITPAAALAFTP